MKQKELILECLKKGWTSPLDALRYAGTMKLSTRVGEFKALGYPIIDKWHPSKQYKLYKLVGGRK